MVTHSALTNAQFVIIRPSQNSTRILVIDWSLSLIGGLVIRMNTDAAIKNQLVSCCFKLNVCLWNNFFWLLLQLQKITNWVLAIWLCSRFLTQVSFWIVLLNFIIIEHFCWWEPPQFVFVPPYPVQLRQILKRSFALA